MLSVVAAAANGIDGGPMRGIGTDNGSGCCSNVGDAATFSKSCSKFTRRNRVVSSVVLDELRPINSSEATYIYMHAGEAARILPSGRHLAQLTEIVVQIRLR